MNVKALKATIQDAVEKYSNNKEDKHIGDVKIYELNFWNLREDENKLKVDKVLVHPMTGYNHSFDTGILFLIFEMEGDKIRMYDQFDSIVGNFPSSMDLEYFDFEDEDYTDYKHEYDEGKMDTTLYDNNEEGLKRMISYLDKLYSWEG